MRHRAKSAGPGVSLRTIESRRHYGTGVRLFVNQSASSLGSPDHGDWLRSQLKARGVAGEQLVIELMLDEITTRHDQVLAFCEPLIRQQAVLVFDDWHASGLADKGLGEARAFAEFLQAHPSLVAEELPGLNYKDKRDPMLFLVTRCT